MNILRPNKLVKGTSLVLLGLVGGYGINSFFKPAIDSQEQVAILQRDNVDLKQKNVDLEDKTINFSVYKKEINSKVKSLKDEIQGLEGKKLGLEKRLSDSDVRNNNLDIKIDNLGLKNSRLYEKLEKLYVNSALNEDYPVDMIVQLMDKAKISYDKTKFVKAASELSSLERQGFFMAFLDEKQLRSSYDDRKRERYFEFFQKGMTTEDKKRVLDNLGINSNNLDQKYSSLSLAVFEIYESSAKNPIRFPAVR